MKQESTIAHVGDVIVAPTDEQLDNIEASSPRTCIRRGETCLVIHGPALPQDLEFYRDTVAHLRTEAVKRPREAEQLEALASVYDWRSAT